MKQLRQKNWVLLAASAAAAVTLVGWECATWAAEGAVAGTAKSQAASASSANPVDGQRAYGYLKQICALGSRMSGSTGMQKQREMLKAHFEKLGAKVTDQRFLAKNPLGGEKVPMANMIIEWHPERKERILLVAHYDTRPFPDRDPDPAKRRSGTFIGANDGGSGTALLMELGHLMPKLEGPIGVDFLLVDGEELVYVERRDPYCLGSTWFSNEYVQTPPAHKYRSGIVLDMVGDRDLQIYKEENSAAWRETRQMVNDIWNTAAGLGVSEFKPEVGYFVQDDHFPLRNKAKIPTCDIIDFADPATTSPPIYWHTTADNIQRCSGSSLAKVGWVVYEWLKAQEAGGAKPQAD